ncbi:hypothetical protein K2Z84_33370 [Candidatus Binatia bacterium]|nr:hypothetical protein [Candidatus Binatia bacterium]
MSKFRFACPGRGAFVVVGIALVAALAPLAARADSGATLTPDRHSYVVNKDVGGERWTINLNLASLTPQRAINVTGNVYRSGQSPSFVWCQERDDSTGTLSDPGSTFRLRCSGASACGETATGCARSQWTLIADPVEIPASFFLPPGGEGIASRDSAIAGLPALALLASAASTTLPPAKPPSLGLTVPSPGTVPASPAANVDRGANLPPDGANFLVNKELGGFRWSISLNQIPAQRGNAATQSCNGDALECIVTRRFLSVTGNVFPLDGSAPQFVWCQERQDSTGDLNDPSSEFRFGCVGTGACTRSANECAAQDWQAIPGGSDINLPASFFLPPGGLPATPQSDPEIVIIGRTSDPPSIVVPLGNGAAAAASSDAATVQASCSDGASCTTSIGSCGSVQGRIVSDPSLGCACLVADVPPECIVCGDGATGQCGGDCQYQTGGGTARGQCLPYSSTSSACACYAANEHDEVAISICGGSLGTECPGDKCCTDDLRDGCDPSRGDAECPGICVDANGCDPRSGQCGSCFDQSGGQTLFCGTLEAPHGASCCEDCPDGSQNCYCDPGRSCNLESEGGGCCPTSRPDLCNGSACIPSGADCCADCPDGGTSCYCAAGSLCVLESDGGGCCPLEKPVGCGGFCLSEGSDCCGDGESYCDPGFLCTAELTCVPAGEDDCGNGFVCDPGYQCVDESPGCCRTDLTCDTTCLTDGEDCCGGGYYCDAGDVCVGGEGPAAGCCPADRPVLCGDSCFPAGTSCDATPSSTSSERTAARTRPDALQSIWNGEEAPPRTGMKARHAPASTSSSSPAESAAAKQQ